MRTSPFDPLGLAPLILLQQRTALEAAQIVLQRSSRMARGTLTPVEATAMWVEKPAAFALGWQGAAMALARGQGVSQILQAGLEPVARRTRSNARRLAR